MPPAKRRSNPADGGHSTPGLVFDRVPLAELSLYHRNPRHGNVDRIRESLGVNGQYRSICVNRGSLTGRPNEVLAGNHTLLAARELGWADIAVTFVDVDDAQATRIVVADNRTSELGDNDDELLVKLLAELPDLDGTGFDPDDVDDLMAALEETAPVFDAPQPSAGGAEDPSGMRQTHTLEEDGNAYASRDTRFLQLIYPLDVFERLVGLLADLGDRYGVESNSAVVQKLILDATAETT